MNYTFEHYRESADFLLSKLGSFQPKVAMVLGSGLGYLGDQVEDPIAVPYGDDPPLQAAPPPRATRAGWCSAAWRARTWP